MILDKPQILKFPNGYRETHTINNVFVVRYRGMFENPRLQAYADSNLWYSRIQGNSFAVEGEGTSPEAAIKDAISRNEDMIKKITLATASLRGALKECPT